MGFPLGRTDTGCCCSVNPEEALCCRLPRPEEPPQLWRNLRPGKRHCGSDTKAEVSRSLSSRSKQRELSRERGTKGGYRVQRSPVCGDPTPEPTPAHSV
uniref:Uncharacterized protein n=1 Tax=Knipowitschia caucasica TaxID=637954 RepID=A0AAV2J3J8_KNICA